MPDERFNDLFPQLADALAAALRDAGHPLAADSVPSLVVTEGVTSSWKAELAFKGRLHPPVEPPAVEGRCGRTEYWAYVEGDSVTNLTLRGLGQFRPVLRRICEAHQAFDWDAYYER